jgi:hypothetical protein
MNIKSHFKMTKKEKVLTLVLLGILIGYGWYETAYGLTMPSNGTMTIDGIKYHGQPGINFTPDYKVLPIENSTW